MKYKVMFILMVTIGALLSTNYVKAQNKDTQLSIDSLIIPDNEKLVIIWTSGDRDVAIKMVFMYAYNAKRNKWWDDITLIVWGPSAKLITEDEELQDYMKKIIDSGIAVKACKGCSDQYGVSEKLEELGINVKYIGKEFTDYIKEGRNILTF
jgi:hypothetical protein